MYMLKSNEEHTFEKISMNQKRGDVRFFSHLSLVILYVANRVKAMTNQSVLFSLAAILFLMVTDLPLHLVTNLATQTALKVVRKTAGISIYVGCFLLVF